MKLTELIDEAAALKKKPKKTVAVGAIVLTISILFVAFGTAYMSEKGKQAAAPVASLPIVALPAPDRLNLNNNGDKDVFLWGTRVGDGPILIDGEPRTLPAKMAYHLYTDGLVIRGEGLTPIELYLSDSGGRHYVDKIGLLVRKVDAGVSEDVQELGISEREWPLGHN